MSKDKIKVVVSTSTNIRFITALPAELTIAKALPLLLNKYKAVVRENLGDHHELLENNWISQITAGGCLISREEVVGELFDNNSEIQLNIGHKEPEKDRTAKIVAEFSKREKIENKKNQKQATENQSEEPQKSTAKPTPVKINPKSERENKPVASGKGQHKSILEANPQDIASKLLNKLRAQQKQEPNHPSSQEPKAAVKPKKIQIVEEESDYD